MCVLFCTVTIVAEHTHHVFRVGRAVVDIGGTGWGYGLHGGQLVIPLVYSVVCDLALVAQKLLARLTIEGGLSLGVCRAIHPNRKKETKKKIQIKKGVCFFHL